MQFDHHNMTGVHLAVALVNLGQPWHRGTLEQVLREHWIARVRLDDPAEEELADLVGRLRRVFEAGTVDARCAAVNSVLAERPGAAFLANHDGLPPHLHFAASSEEVVSRVRAFTAGSLAMFLVESEGRRLGTCARAGCGTVFADTSRNGLRTYCSTRCGNGDAVRRHRQRSSAARG